MFIFIATAAAKYDLLEMTGVGAASSSLAVENDDDGDTMKVNSSNVVGDGDAAAEQDNKGVVVCLLCIFIYLC